MSVSVSDYKGPLHQMAKTTPSVLWNDSASINELEYALAHGAVGATCNPVIVGEVLKKDMHLWKERIGEIVVERPRATEDEIAWRVIEEISVKGAALLRPVFEREKGKNGRFSIQTDPRLYRDPQAIVDHAVRLDRLAPNIIVKIPVTRAGVEAIEEATARGISINATVSFSVSQCLAVAEAVERGLVRREKRGEPIDTMGPVCTVMVGRLDDWLKVVAHKQNIIADPVCLEWAGVAVMKKAYRLFTARGYRLRLLSAAFRNHLHWSEFMGGNVVISPPHVWQARFNASDILVTNRMDCPVDPAIVAELHRRFPDFRAAYDEDGMRVVQFDAFPPTIRVLRQFIAAYGDLCTLLRDFMLPNPDAV